MPRPPPPRTVPFMNDTLRAVPRLAGALLALGAIGFVIVFSILAAAFGYPEVLARPAAEVLPALIAGGTRLRLVWTVYALLPATVVATALLVRRALPFRRRANLAVTGSGVLAGVAMTVGLTRWPTLQWSLGERWVATTDSAVHARLAASFSTFNHILGNVVGEFLGEVALAAWLLGVGLAARRSVLGRATLGLAGLMCVGALRNVAPATQWATDLTNVLLPLVMLGWGLRWALRGLRGQRTAVAAPDAAGPRA